MKEYKPLPRLEPLTAPKHVPEEGFLTDRPTKRLAPKSAFLKALEKRQKDAAKPPKSKIQVVQSFDRLRLISR